MDAASKAFSSTVALRADSVNCVLKNEDDVARQAPKIFAIRLTRV
jgi:hypothetical protein